MPSTDRELLDEHLSGDLAPIADRIEALVAPSWRLLPADGTAGTRLGGAPDLPPDTGWPANADGRPLQFLAQIETADAPDRGPLPEGRLAFFYDTLGEPWGFDPADRPGHRVLFVAPGTATEPREPPAVEDALTVSEQALAFTAELTLPERYAHAAGDAIGEEHEDAYDALFEALLERREAASDSVHRLLGHPDPVQGDMQPEAQFASNGIYVGNAAGYRDPRTKELAAGIADWRLLLQLDTDGDAMWGDMGRLYFWIRDQDLRAARLDATWMILQSS